MKVPLNRMAWAMVAIFAPAGLLGWVTQPLGLKGCFAICCLLTVLISAAVGSLSWAEHVGLDPGPAKGCLAYAWVPLALIGGIWVTDTFRTLGPALGLAGYFLGLTLLMALMNPEGLTLFLSAIVAILTTGLAEGCCEEPGLRLPLGLGVSLVTLGSCFLFSLLRHIWRRRRSSRGAGK